MCSNQEDGDLFPQPGISADSLEGRKCMKCEQLAVVIIRINDAFCKDCFLLYCTHKFRSAFGKSKLIRDQEKVLVAFSSGRCSSAMRHLIQEGSSKRAQKKLRFTPTLVYIDDGSITGTSDCDRKRNTTSVVEQMRKSGIECYAYAFEQVMEEKKAVAASGFSNKVDLITVDDVTSYLQQLNLESNPLRKSLDDLLSSAKSLTAKENLIFTLRQRLLIKIADELGYGKVLVGDSATRLSIRLLSNITQGRGAHLPFETSFSDHRNSSVMIIRPMREFPDKEIVFYNRLNNIECVFTPTPGTKQSTGSSIDRLTEDFVLGLQADYPNTVSTIFRTGEKLDPSAIDAKNKEHVCVMCEAPLDTDVGTSSALRATELSQELARLMNERRAVPGAVSAATGCSGTGACDDKTSDECCGQGDGECRSKAANTMTLNSLKSVLCYGCRLVAKDLDDCNRLPDSLLEAATHQLNRQQMKDSIKDFLL